MSPAGSKRCHDDDAVGESGGGGVADQGASQLTELARLKRENAELVARVARLTSQLSAAAAPEADFVPRKMLGQALSLTTGSVRGVPVVLKRIRMKPDPNPLSREAEMMRKVGPHPHIARLLDVEHKLVVELLTPSFGGVGKENLADAAYCAERGLATEQIFCSLSRDIARAVRHMHRRGVYHADIKLRNTGFVLQGQVLVFKLFDFGSECPIHDAELCKLVDNRSFLTMIMSVLTWDLFPSRTTNLVVLSDQYETMRSKDEEAPMFELFPWLAEPVQYFAEARAE
jgi:serine/threonine protein kinase